MEALILAAGMGKRLYPLTKSLPKPMVMINNKPILHYTLKTLKSYGVSEVIIVVGYMGDVIKEYFKEGEEYNLKIRYLSQDNHKGGTGEAVKLAKDYIKGDKFLLIFGDNLFNPNVLGELFKKSDFYKGILCCKEMPSSKLGGWIRINNDKITSIEEGKGFSDCNLQNQGLMILPKEVFSTLDKIKLSPRGELELTDAIQLMIEKKFEIGYVLTNYEILNISSVEDLNIAESIVKNFKT